MFGTPSFKVGNPFRPFNCPNPGFLGSFPVDNAGFKLAPLTGACNDNPDVPTRISISSDFDTSLLSILIGGHSGIDTRFPISLQLTDAFGTSVANATAVLPASNMANPAEVVFDSPIAVRFPTPLSMPADWSATFPEFELTLLATVRTR
jgi:hypothetical protein